MKIGIFLDDERAPSDVTWLRHKDDISSWHVVRNFQEFKQALENYSYDVISFDHDLCNFVDGVEYTGKSCLNLLINNIMENRSSLPEVYFHTQNIVGRENMKCLWDNFVEFYRGEGHDKRRSVKTFM